MPFTKSPTAGARRRCPRVLAVALLPMMLSACAPSATAPPEAQSALLLTIDTWRADGIGAGGDPVVRTPWLDRFFRSGIQFAEAHSPIPSTLPSHTSMLTGAWPTQHGVTRNRSEVPDDIVSIAEVLEDEGFSTAAFVSAAVLDERFRLGQGFQKYDFRATNEVDRDQPWRPAPRTLHRALTWWDSTPGRRFLWAHVFEPHHPYEVNPLLVEVYDPGYEGPANGSMRFVMGLWGEEDFVPADVTRHMIALYRAEITAVDRIVGLFLDRIPREGTAIIITSDHGESLGEHDLHFRHGPKVFPADIHVPMVVYPGRRASAVSGTLVRTIDVPGTFLPLLGVDTAMSRTMSTDGDDLMTRVHGEDLPIFGVAAQPWEVMAKDGYPNSTLQRVIRERNAAWVETPWAGTAQWYDRTRDPGELTPADPPDPAEANRMRARLDDWIDDVVPFADLVEVDGLREQLEALGYVE